MWKKQFFLFGLILIISGCGSYPLHEAVMRDSVSDVDSIISEDYDLDTRKGGATALHLASQTGNRDIVNHLLSKGADPDGKSKDGELTPLFFAASIGHTEIVTILIEHGANIHHNCTVYKDKGWTPLFFAVEEGHDDIALILIENGADPDAKSSSGLFPLYKAVSHNSFSCVKLLIDKGAGLNNYYKGYTSLHAGSKFGSEDVVELLIERGAEVNARGGYGATPLFISIYSEKISVVRLLLENGADPKLANEEGATPLHMAAQENLPEIARLLIENGALCGAKRNDGATPTDSAIKSGAREIVDLLKQCDED